MDFDKVLANREIREARNARPYVNYREGVDQCIAAGRDIVRNEQPSSHQRLLERSVVITFVTHIEVYFRDMLDAVFRVCKPDYFLPHLKHIHQSKYSIEELIHIYQKQIHPLELVSSDMSFQNTDKIEKVFSRFLGGSLWNAAINIQVRIPNRPETAVSFEAEYLEGLKRIFELRHELVHNPKNSPHLTPDLLKDITNADGLILAVDCVLSKMLSDHMDPLLEEKG
ncbi:hypothetical protein FIU85_08795 [Roseovarius sp. THAF8]|uniref:HEPN domain-containing protein n=1 Tax=Roseovarius sp. THAF8 TaxID=2587846 RepID=UPI001268864F|nr:HEPN domain-containing protein [Roseovarius sp. THAF8]QFT97397.1 hypothetical protein FIU85_08795 [Roseovarius sp. THAF8]